MRKAVFIDLPNFYSRLLKSGLGEPRELRDYFLYWLDLDLVSKWLTGEFCPTWVFYSGRRFGPSSERIENQLLEAYIKRISRLTSVTPYDVNIPGEQRESFTVKCECGKTVPGQWESEKGVDASLIVHLFDTANSWEEAVLLSGDADFTPAVRALRRQGKIVSGAGFSNASECLVREFYSFEDLSSQILRSDFAAYLLFGNEKLITRWMTDKIAPEDVKDKLTNVKLTCEWTPGREDESLYSGGRRVLINQYGRVSFGFEGLIEKNSRLSLLEDFCKNFPELAFHRAILSVNPLVWERIDRVLPKFLQLFSGAATGDIGRIESVFSKQSDGAYLRKLGV
jgi:uncharacterized LabA/DUF88 family protein